MAEKLKIIPLGGLNEIGKNMTVLEYGKDIIIVDCGLGFPDDEMYGVDLVIADMTYLVKNKDRIRGMFLTHGHEDHIGGIPYAMEQFRCPIHATRLTAGIVQLKLEEHQLQNAVHLFTHEAGEKVKAGCFTVEFIHVNHSIADAVAFAIKTPVGTVVMTGDFKIDATAEDGMIDLARFGALGKEGVLALLCDSTNVERQGYTPSERTVAGSFERQFTGCNKRIIVTTFASNAFRLQSLITVAKKFGRKVAVTGRSMENILKVSTELGYLKIPAGTLVDINQIKQIPNNKLVIVSTGSQGENMSALYRMAFSGHRQVEITASDRVIISASAIPGNEKSIGKIINELYRKGAEVIYDTDCSSPDSLFPSTASSAICRHIRVWPRLWAWIPRIFLSPISARCLSLQRPPASGAAPFRPAGFWSTAPASATSEASFCATGSIWRRTVCSSWSSTFPARTAASSPARTSLQEASST